MSYVPEPWALIDLRASRKAYEPIFRIEVGDNNPDSEPCVIADIWNVDPDPEGYTGQADPWGGVTEDTAHLLLAAPKMLRALKKVHERRRRNKPITLGDLDEVKAAIAEAEGKEVDEV